MPMAWDVTSLGGKLGSGGCTSDTAADHWAKCKAVYNFLTAQVKDTGGCPRTRRRPGGSADDGVRRRAELRAERWASCGRAGAARLRFACPAASSGQAGSIADPLVTSHVELTSAGRVAPGVPGCLARYSAGIEDAADLITDLAQALESA